MDNESQTLSRAEDAEIPYQTLINLYLRECARTRKKPAMKWEAA
jgi:hypothetical protein